MVYETQNYVKKNLKLALYVTKAGNKTFHHLSVAAFFNLVCFVFTLVFLISYRRYNFSFTGKWIMTCWVMCVVFCTAFYCFTFILACDLIDSLLKYNLFLIALNHFPSRWRFISVLKLQNRRGVFHDCTYQKEEHHVVQPTFSANMKYGMLHTL